MVGLHIVNNYCKAPLYLNLFVKHYYITWHSDTPVSV